MYWEAIDAYYAGIAYDPYNSCFHANMAAAYNNLNNCVIFGP